MKEIISNYIKSKYGVKKSKNIYDTSLFNSGIIDSIRFLDLITFLETEFDLRIEGDELLPEYFDSINKIELFIKNYKKN